MPLSQPTSRTLQHTREVICQGYQRDDGLWDIEGHLTDTKTVRLRCIERNDGYIPVGEPLHGMALRITVDLDLNILDAEASMDYTPFELCPSIADTYRQLIGLKIESGFTKKTRTLFGGVKGCTHLVELLGPLATTAYQATHQARQARDKGNWDEGSEPPPLLNSCHTFDSTGPVVEKYWPHFVTSND